MVDVELAVRELVEALRETPEFRALWEAARAINHDREVQSLLQQIRSHQSALRWGQGNGAEHLRALRQLQAQLETYPSVQAYRTAEQALRALFREVDETISRAAGVEFAANARRSCCG
ncbi:MAG: YlbF family regulator [Anaerolineae bacterium]